MNNAIVYLNTKSKTIRVVGQSEENDYSEVYLIGDINNTGWYENITRYPLKLKEGTTNVYEGTYTFTGASNFFKMKAGSLVYGTGDDDNIEIENSYTCEAKQGGMGAFVVGPGEYTFTYELDKNAETGRLSVNAVVHENTFDVVYLIGEFNGGTWEQFTTSYPLKPKAGTTDVYVGVYSFTGNANYFKIKAGEYTYGYNHDIEAEYDTKYQSYPGGPGAFGFEEGESAFTFAYDKNTDTGNVTVSKDTTSAATIETADGEAAYYTLQGIRVDVPTEGLYIKVVDGKASKVLIRK